MKLKKTLLSAAFAALPSSLLQAAEPEPLDAVIVTARRSGEGFAGTSIDADRISSRRAATGDTARLLGDVPGVSLYGAGGVSSLPAIHGLADDRLRIKVDGMDLIASCPNHMNPALSYIDPSQLGTLTVYAGIAPVSMGGDSIGGTIAAASPAPTFAAPGQGSLFNGEIGAYYRSNNGARGIHLSAVYATEAFNISYRGAASAAGNYTAGGDFKTFTATGRGTDTLPLDEVGSSAYRTKNHALGIALKGGNHLLEARLGFQDMPRQLYPNQRMDLLDNTQHSLNLRYLGQLHWGTLEARLYRENVSHFMEFGPDKRLVYTAGNSSQGMPMNTAGSITGATVKASIDLGMADLLRIGGEWQRYRLDDWWPAVTGAAMMGPNDFLNVHHGVRSRAALFGEWEARLGPRWLTLFGLRHERVHTQADRVHGYEQATFPASVVGMDMMNQKRDASRFNTADRDRSDNNLDLTVLARYTLSATQDIEFGFARKVRSPSLYERYAWSTANMMAIMNNVVGDGNGYIGNPDLKPEKAHTLSATFDWHAPDRDWEFKATPFYTRVADYIDAVQWDGVANAPRAVPLRGQFVTLRYANQAARLYGIDLSGRLPLAKSDIGALGLKGVVNYTDGRNRDTGEALYNIMPLNARIALTQALGNWENSLEVVAVAAKNRVSEVRNEIRTPGYGLVNLRMSHTWQQARFDVGIDNLFDRAYALPLGGAYVGQGTTMGIALPWGIAVPGMGRSLYAEARYTF